MKKKRIKVPLMLILQVTNILLILLILLKIHTLETHIAGLEAGLFNILEGLRDAADTYTAELYSVLQSVINLFNGSGS